MYYNKIYVIESKYPTLVVILHKESIYIKNWIV
ncbi:hypothetical protein NXX09_06165 [Bacteroides uniformis]|nr:hypothetical protein [Bacteroides uniformis]